MSAVHISVASAGKLRPAMQTIKVNDKVADIEYRTQVEYHKTLGYKELSCCGGIWQGARENSVVTISTDMEVEKK